MGISLGVSDDTLRHLLYIIMCTFSSPVLIFCESFISPDEIERMRSHGNDKAKEVYGGDGFRPSLDAAESIWRQFIVDKYEKKKFAPEIYSIDIDHPVVPTKEGKTDETDLISFDNDNIQVNKTKSKC